MTNTMKPSDDSADAFEARLEAEARAWRAARGGASAAEFEAWRAVREQKRAQRIEKTRERRRRER